MFIYVYISNYSESEEQAAGSTCTRLHPFYYSWFLLPSRAPDSQKLHII